jgi:cyclopropane-fatty-acyl-phospholipid synthase
MPSRTYDPHAPDLISTATDAETVKLGNIARLPGLNIWMRAVFRIAAHISAGNLVIVMPDGRKFRFTGETPGETGIMIVRDPRFAKRLLLGGGTGFAGAYLDGQWDTPDLRTLLRIMALNNASIGARANGARTIALLERVRHIVMRRNSRGGARRNIEYHYDLGNDFYALWLDASMTYSSALFRNSGESLEQAQHNKYRALAQRIGLGPEHHLLEIGCGWGGFAEFAGAEIGCNVTGITISPKQYEYARRRIFEKGLADRVNILLQDYRDVTAQYDRIASIEMFEAVGESYWPHYFSRLRDGLLPGGLAGIQLITIADRHFESYRRGRDFIQRYIFPGGMLASPAALREQIGRAGLRLVEQASFGADYADTLRRWHERFLARWPEIEKLGFDARFRRMWQYYLAYCESGFMSRNTDVVQMSLARA